MENIIFLKKKTDPKNQIKTFLFCRPTDPIFLAFLPVDQKIDLVSPKNNFMRTKALILAKKKFEQAKSKASLAVPQNIRPKCLNKPFLKKVRTKHQNRAWLSLILYCM